MLDTNQSDSEAEPEEPEKTAVTITQADKDKEVLNELKEQVSLFQDEDSLEDELPYVPTTLPIERPMAAVITPIRMRISQVKTTPILRPRCSTFIGPSSIKDYSTNVLRPTDSDGDDAANVKIRVQLPRVRGDEPESPSDGDVPIIRTVPVKASLSSVNWEAFAGAALRGPRNFRRLDTLPEESPYPPVGTPPNSVTQHDDYYFPIIALPPPSWLLHPSLINQIIVVN